MRSISNHRPVTTSPASRRPALMLTLACLALAGSAAPALAGNVPDGEQAGYTTSGSLEQVVDVSPGDSCTFSMWVGKRSDGAGIWGRWYVQLTTGGWNIQNVLNGSLAAQTEEWVQYQTTFTVANFPNLPIKLRLKGQWGFEVYDLVTLDCGGEKVTNGSFESPVIPDGTWSTFGNPPPDDWTTIGGGAGLFNPNTAQFSSLEPTVSSLDQVIGLPTGTVTVDACGQTFPTHVDNDGSSSWLLVGRGREGWLFTDAGEGAYTTMTQDLGTTAAFVPAAMPSACINELLTDAGKDLTEVEIRIKRAAATDGSDYQEVRWRPTSQTTWTWNFPGSSYGVVRDVSSSALGAGVSGQNANTFDCCDNSHQRIFTWPWGGHNSQKGFSYGLSVCPGTNSPTSFLWEFTTECHSMPYTEVYIRPE